jgi:RNA-directed DNA polymerase
MHKLKKIIKNSASLSQENLILKLSTNIRIWSYYYHLISNKKILQYCDYLLFKMLWRWCCRRHPNKNKKWIKYKYFHQINGNKWIFGIYKNSNSQLMSLPNHTDIKLLRF